MAVCKCKLRSEYKIHNWTVEYCSAVKRKKKPPVICRDVDGPRVFIISQKEKKQILYIIAYIWNLEKWYR